MKLTGSDWSYDSIEYIWDIVQDSAKQHNWKGFPVIFEIVSAEQMLNCYVSHGMPIMYEHWSFGKHYMEELNDHINHNHGLAYELIINSSPSVCYLMNTNTQLMQLLTIAHAGIGHNHFFKHNYMFKQWTQPDEIIDYCLYAKKYIEKCERKYGRYVVELFLDFAHSMNILSIDKHFNKELNKAEKKERHKERLKELRDTYDPVISGNYEQHKRKLTEDLFNENLPVYGNLIKAIVENIDIPKWQKNILQIVQKLMQYFYPQGCTKMMNEGFASFTQYVIINDLYDKGLIGEDYMLEFIENHTAVVNQHWFTGKSFPSINPYYLGFNMFMDIKRMCENPTQEDIDFCPHICNTDWSTTINDIVANYRDDSFVEQFLSPYLIRKLKLVSIDTTKDDDYLNIKEVHDERGYNKVRDKLANIYSWDKRYLDADIIVDKEFKEITIGLLIPLNEDAIEKSITDFLSYFVNFISQLDYTISVVKLTKKDGVTAVELIERVKPLL